MFDRLGRVILRIRWFVIAFWFVAAAVFGLLAPSLAKVGSADETSFLPADAESLTARNVGRAAFPADAAPSQALIVFSRSGGLTDADRVAIDGLRAWFMAADNPVHPLQYVTAESSPQFASMFRSSDGVVELAEVNLDTPSFLPATNTAIDQIRAHLGESGVLPTGLQAQVTGQAGIGRDYLKAIQDGTDRTTIVTIVLVVLVLLLIYRAPLAALVPLITIGVAFLVSRGILGFLAQGGWKLSSVLDSFIVVLAFGVGTDYTIFLLSRFREELGRNRREDAVRVTVSRIGAVITASAATVVVGLTSMVAARFGMIQTTGPALAIVIVVTLLAGLTLTPSLLAVSGRHLFWPLHEQTRTVTDHDQGFWAGLARLITARPAILSVVVLALLAAPLAALPQLKQNFDVLQELPSNAPSRLGFETLSAHLGSGQLMPLVVYVQNPGGNLDTSSGLRALGELDGKIVALGGIQSVRSVVDPNGTGGVADTLKPASQLAAMAAQFAGPASGDLNTQLSDATLNGLKSAQSYVAGLASAYPKVAGSAALTGATADLSTLVAGLVASRESADVANQLDAIAGQIQAAAGSSGSDPAAQLAQLASYMDELGAAIPSVRAEASYQSIEAALATLAKDGTDQLAGLQLLTGIRSLAAWFDARPTPFYFSPSTATPSADALAQAQAMADARARLAGELSQLASGFGPDDLYAPPDLLSAYESSDHTVARMYVVTSTDPYDTRSFETVAQLRSLLSSQVSAVGPSAHAYVGGSTAEFADVQSTITTDFTRVAFITIFGILIVLILLLRAVVAPVYLVLTVLLSYGGSLSLSALILQRGFGEAGINYFIPLMVFVLLVALGSDYNIFLMSRVREESATRPLREGIRYASARTGTVITSAGLILAGTFAALLSSPLQLLFQVGLAVALGVLIDTFVVRSLLVPAITARIGDAAWWPFHRTAAGHGLEPAAVVIEPPE
jgi:RND superfamily putative drug exporter